MKHLTERELIAYREGDPQGRPAASDHLRDCAQCREELRRIEAVYLALDTMSVPDPGDDFESRLWQQLSPRLLEKRARWWEGLLLPRRLVLAGAMAALILLGFLAGRFSKTNLPGGSIADTSKVRERVLVVAVGEHLGRSEMVLVELANTEPEKGRRLINISAEQKRAEDLVEANRLYRQTALHEGDIAMASTLDELERVLLDIANSPDEVTPAQFESLQKRIESKGILFKVRVVHQDLQERQKAAVPAPNQEKSALKEKNKA